MPSRNSASWRAACRLKQAIRASYVPKLAIYHTTSQLHTHTRLCNPRCPEAYRGSLASMAHTSGKLYHPCEMAPLNTRQE